MTDGGTMMRAFVRTLLAVALALMSIACVGNIASADIGGSVSGCVQTDNGTPIIGAHVIVYNWETDMFAGEGKTNENGTYSIDGLVCDTYRIKADAAGYLPEYYRDGTQTQVTVIPPYSTDNIDFTLTVGSSISGHIYQWDGVNTIIGGRVAAYAEIAGAWECVATTDADSDGGYSITIGTEEGTYRVRAQAAGFAPAYYSSMPDCASDSEIHVSAGSSVEGIDFCLAESGFISGTVYRADGLTPISGAIIAAYDNATGVWIDEGVSGSDAGHYYINLPPSTYRLRAKAAGYVAEWYANQTAFSAATSVSVFGLNEQPDINFTLYRVLTITTEPALNFTTTSARLHGYLSSLGAEIDVTVSFAWGTTAGSYPHETPGQVRTMEGPISFELSGLAQRTTYYYRAKADSDAETVFGVERSFTTTDTIDTTPPVMSSITCNVTSSTANMIWTTDELATSQIDFGPTEDYGDTTGESPTMTTSFNVSLVDLSPNTTYHYQIICKDASGNETAVQDSIFRTKAYYEGMATTTWQIIGFAVVVGVAIATSLIWIWTRTKKPECPTGNPADQLTPLV
jgi:hypothetical protein